MSTKTKDYYQGFKIFFIHQIYHSPNMCHHCLKEGYVIRLLPEAYDAQTQLLLPYRREPHRLFTI